MPPTILVSPAAFKGSFSPRQVADAIVSGVRRALPGAVVLSCPAADGGDGLLDAVLPPGSFREHVRVTGPLGVPVSAELGWLDAETAILESASACGLALLKPEERDPLRATTRGVGELIFEAVDRGARTVIVGLGGSATVDGGTGAARGLGWTFQDLEGAPLPEGGGALLNLAVLGGGWGLEAKLAALAKADLVITGEGTFDRTSLAGKAAGEVLRRAQAARKKVAVVAGRAVDLIGAHTVSGEGETLDLAGVARLGERAAREALGLPAV